MVAKKAHIEKSDRANQGGRKSTLPDKEITTQELHPSFFVRTKEDCYGLSLPHTVSKKSHIEKSDRVNQGYAESTLPGKKFTNQELHPSNCMRTKEGCTSLSSPHEHTIAKKAHDGYESKNGHAENSNAIKKVVLNPSVELNHVTKEVKKPMPTTPTQPQNKPQTLGRSRYRKRVHCRSQKATTE